MGEDFVGTMQARSPSMAYESRAVLQKQRGRMLAKRAFTCALRLYQGVALFPATSMTRGVAQLLWLRLHGSHIGT